MGGCALARPHLAGLLDLNVEHVRRLPVLLIVTFRPEFQPPWAGQPQVSMLALNMEFIQVPCGQSRYHAHRGELDRAQSLAKDLLHVSRRRNDSAGLVMGHYCSGRNLMFVGSFASSRSHLETVLALTIRTPITRSCVRPESTRSWQHRRPWGSSSFVSAFPTRLGTEQQGNCRRAETAPSVDFGHELGHRRPSAIDHWRRHRLGAAGGQLGCGRERSGFPFLSCNGRVKAKNADVTAGLCLLHAGSSAYCATGPRRGCPCISPS
jgi:hypothetical protein